MAQRFGIQIRQVPVWISRNLENHLYGDQILPSLRNHNSNNKARNDNVPCPHLCTSAVRLSGLKVAPTTIVRRAQYGRPTASRIGVDLRCHAEQEPPIHTLNSPNPFLTSQRLKSARWRPSHGVPLRLAVRLDDGSPPLICSFPSRAPIHLRSMAVRTRTYSTRF
jgi:hypothetical protein